MAESFGVAGRGKFYEEAGAIRDVVQNHMLQVIACLAMECPAGNDHEARRDERGRLLKAVRTLDAVRCRARPVPRLPARARRGPRLAGRDVRRPPFSHRQ